MHNSVNCYNKPDNEDKHTHKTSQKLSPLGPSKNKNQSFRAQLIKLLEEESNDLESQIGFSLGTIKYDICDLQSENSIPSISSQKSKVVLETCNNIVCNKITSFKIPVTLCVRGQLYFYPGTA